MGSVDVTFPGKMIVFEKIQHNGDVIIWIIPDSRNWTIKSEIIEIIEQESTFPDEW